jgi:hypothetical protein
VHQQCPVSDDQRRLQPYRRCVHRGKPGEQVPGSGQVQRHGRLLYGRQLRDELSGDQRDLQHYGRDLYNRQRGD